MAAEGVQKMSKYVKPVISLDEGMAEGVYAASGCYTASAYIHQTPTDNIGFGDLVVTSDAGLAITGVSITD